MKIAAIVFGGVAWAARCTTVLNPAALLEYQNYVTRSEQAMSTRFGKGELAWVADSGRREALAELSAGRQVRRNVSDPAVNQRAAERNATVLDWIGAIRIRATRIEDLVSVLQDYAKYSTMYRPIIFACKSQPIAGSHPAAYDVVMGLQNSFNAASIFPQHYAFELKSRTEYSGDGQMLLVHSRSSEVRESDSGVPGRADFLELHHDHGIMWAVNTYWRARQSGPDLYVEFEAITLARSVQGFQCKIGIIPVPKMVIAGVMDSIPSESLEVMLSATKAECERRSLARTGRIARE
jgi:hypothetical protein